MDQFYTLKEIRSAAILTNSYVAATVIGQPSGVTLESNNQVLVYVDFTIGSLTSAQIKVEFSHDGTNYYQDTFIGVAGTVATCSLGEYSFGATGAYRLAIPTKDRYVKISAKGTGTVTSSSMTIKAIIATA